MENDKIKSVALIGAGAIGSVVSRAVMSRPDVSFCLLAEGERRERLMRDGLVVNGERLRPQVMTPQEAQNVDLIVVATKYPALPAAVDAVAAVAGPQTTVLSLLNGIDSEDIIARRIGSARVLDSVTIVQGQRKDGEVIFNADVDQVVFIGERDSPEVTPRMQRLCDLFEGTCVTCVPRTDIRRDQWVKYSLNIIHNLPQAFLGVGFGAYADSSYVAAIRDALYAEICQVAAAVGVTLDERIRTPPFAADVRFSTLQDLDAHRHTEIGMFVGALIRIATERNVAIPICEFVYLIIRALEEKGDGRFSYQGNKGK